MSDSRSRRRRSAALFLAALLGVWLGASRAAAHDIPDEIHLHGFVKPEGDRVHFLVRIPLTLLLNIDLPKRGPGFIDLAYVDERLGAAMAAAGKDLVLFENGVRLTPLGGRARISLPSDRSFETYEKALALIAGSPLPKSTDVFWNQGYFDAHLEYPIRSARSDFAFHLRVAPGLGPRLKMALRFLTPDGNTRAYLLTGGTARTALDPRWHQAARVFVKAGFLHILEGLDHLLFLLCLVIPFRLFTFGLLAVVTSFTVAHSITLIAASLGAAPAGEWFPPLVETLIAASIVYMALENILAPSLDRRWLITGVFGLAHGFAFSYGLTQTLQFAGSHLMLSLLSFNVGIELGQVLVILVALPALGVLHRHPLGTRYGGIILSALLAHTGWHWMLDRAEALRQVPWPTLDAVSAVTLARWTLLVLLLAGAAWLIGRQIGGRLAPKSPAAREDAA